MRKAPGIMPSSTILDQTAELAADVVDAARTSLMASVRFMDVALWRMPLATKRLAASMATDGYLFYLDPVAVVRAYKDDENEVLRNYLHAILHCVFRHPFDDSHPDQELWDMACDVAVEACALELVGLRFPSVLDAERRRALEKLGESCGNVTAPKLYNVFAQVKSGGEASPATKRPALSMRFVESLPALFARDDHSVWTRQSERPPAQIVFDDDVTLIGTNDERMHGEHRVEEIEDEQPRDREAVNMAGAPSESQGGLAAEAEIEGGDRFVDIGGYEEGEESFASMIGVQLEGFDDINWTDIGKMIEVELEAFTGKPGVDAGVFEVNLAVSSRKTYDYREFLKRFSALSEEMKVSTEEFDYVYYTYGLSRYGNMPLVEPLEYQECRRIREFVIAIDTSASCAGGLVRHFVEKTYDVLRNSASFGRKVNVHVVQCDSDIRKDTKITTLRDLDGDFGEFATRGYGGTDFRPVFKYVDELVESRELPNLKGMIYLTDGIGKYPEEPPDYECAFVFVDDDCEKRTVPPWAMKVLMTKDEIVEL